MSTNFSDGLQLTNYVYYDMYVTYKNAGPSFMLCFMSIILNIIVIPGIFMNASIIYVTIKYYKHENVKKNFYLGFMVIFSLGCGSLVALKFWDIATRFPDVPQTGTLSDVFLFEFKPLFFVYMATNTAVCKESRNNAKLFKSMFTIVSVTIGCYLMSAAVRLVILPPFHLGEINVWIIELAFGTLLNLGVALNAVVLYICSQEYRKCFNRELLLFGSIFGIIRRVSDNLEANTLYKFTIRAVYSDGESEDSVILTAKTAQNYGKIIDITEKGANGDGKTINTDAIQGAINDCGQTSSAFDCKVLVPEGTFISGALFMQTPLTLELAEEAILQGSGESSDFPKNKGRSGKPPSLLNVIDKPVTNLRITGKGSVNGNGWETDQVLEDEVGNEMPIYSKGDSNDYRKGILAKSQLSGGGPFQSSRSSLASFCRVMNLFIGGNLTFKNPSFHGLEFDYSSNIAIINNRLLTYAVTNGDGIDLGSCSNVQILNNLLDTGDDAFALSAGAGRIGENGKPTECILIRNNYIRHSHGAPSAGSHTAAWIKNLLVEYNVIVSASNGIRCKSSPIMGGGVKNAIFRNIAMLNVGSKNTANLGNIQLDGITEEGSAIILTLNYLDETKIEFSEITIDNVNKGNSGPSILMEGYDKSQTNYPKTYLKNILVKNLNLTNVSPIQITQLLNSSFVNVQINNFNGNSAWKINDAQKLKFENVPTLKRNNWA
uniref:Polygalacturonase n=1 Tax=Meloidogyne javanica TaxID=6303 RepID=A0A915MBI1_MELJA